MKLVICTKFHVNWMNCVKSRRGEVLLTPLKASCNYFSFEASRVKGPKGSHQVNGHFDCTTSNIIYCITCTLCSKLYIGESGRKLGDHFREHLLDTKNKGLDLSKPVARHFNLPGHSHEHMEICGINLHLGNNETRKRKEQRLIFKLGTLAPNGIKERFPTISQSAPTKG